MTEDGPDGEYQEIFYAVNDAIIVHDIETGDIVDVNRAASELTGYSRAEIIDGNVGDLSPGDKYTQERAEKLMASAVAGGKERFEWCFERKNGERVWAEVNLKPALIRGEERLLAVIRETTERRSREQAVEALHEAMRDMVEASDEERVAEIAVETAADVLGLPVSGVWLAGKDGERLVPAAQTHHSDAIVPDAPTYTAADDSLSWRAFEAGELHQYDDLSEEGTPYNPETPIQSELVVPLGDHGVMNIGATEPNAFEASDVSLARLLAANTEAALERVIRERTLRERTEELEQQAGRMEFFNSILRHDVLNGMTVIRGNSRLLADDLSGEPRDRAETIHEWAGDVTDVVSRVRNILDMIAGESRIELRPVDLSTVLRTEIQRIESTYPSVTVDHTIPDGVSVTGEDLLGDVFGNVLRNAVEHNDSDELRITVTVKRGDESVQVRIADDGTGIPDERKETVFRRGQTGHAKRTGSGFGLFFVDAMVSEYGGDIRLEDAAEGGAAFVFTLPAASDAGTEGEAA